MGNQYKIKSNKSRTIECKLSIVIKLCLFTFILIHAEDIRKLRGNSHQVQDASRTGEGEKRKGGVPLDTKTPL